VGIDPGATFGIALLGLDGRKIALRSTSGGFSDAARIIEQQGTPSLVACDTNPAPEAALRLASYFSCRLFVPRQSVREDEKRQVSAGAGTQNAHERDAYTAAVLAWRASQNKLRQIDALEGLAHAEKEKVKHLLLRGVRVQDAFMMLREPEKEDAAMKAKVPSTMKAASPEELRQRLESLARENANLRLALERLEEEKAALLHRMRLMENGVRESVMRDSEFRKLRFQLQQAMNRLTWRKRPKTAHAERQQHAAPQKKREEPTRGKIEINNGEPEIDLERLVADYRKGRK